MSKNPNENQSRKTLHKLARWYRTVAIVSFNTIVLFVSFNVLVFFALKIRNNYFGVGTPTEKYSEQALASVYPEYTVTERKELISANWNRPFLYDSYVLLKEAPCRGKYLNVNEAGFREVKDQGPWPPDSRNVNVFVFGGSTTFGYGVADDETIPSYLQESLRRYSRKNVCVYNFGVAAFYSTQERILFERMLTQGRKPDVVVFIDGLNDFIRIEDDPAFSPRISANFDKSPAQLFVGGLPMMRILNKLEKETGRTTPSDDQIASVLKRYQFSKRIIESVSREYGITPIFVWQPVPSYEYDTKYHLFYWSSEEYEAHARGYKQLDEIRKTGVMGESFLWCADLQNEAQECLYVDIHHYTASFSRKIAEAICQLSLERGILKDAGIQVSPPVTN